MTSIFDASVRDVDFADLADDARIPVGESDDETPAVTTKGSVTAGLKGDKGDKGDQGDQGDIGPLGNQGIQGIQGEEAEGGTVNLGSRRIADYWESDRIVIAVANRLAATGLVVPEDERTGYWQVNLGSAVASGAGQDADWHRIDVAQLFALPDAISGSDISVDAANPSPNTLVLAYEREGFSTVQFAHSASGQLLITYGVVQDFYNFKIRRELHTAFPVPPSNAIKLLENYLLPNNWAQPSSPASAVPPDNLVLLTTALPNVPGKVYICARQGANLCAWYLDCDAETLYRGQIIGDQIKRTGSITGFSHVSVCVEKGENDSELIFKSPYAASVGPADSRIDVWFEPSAAASPVPLVIFGGDVSAQVAADRVLYLNFDLPSTGVLEFVGDTAQIDSDPVQDTPGKDILQLGSIRCADLQLLEGITSVQAMADDWQTYPKMVLLHPGVYDASFPLDEVETIASQSTLNHGLFINKIVGDADVLAVKIGGPNTQAGEGRVRDFAPLTIRWIP